MKSNKVLSQNNNKGLFINNKGFTLAEMLIVVAILGVLLVILISSISNVIEKSREAADLVAIKAAYEEIMRVTQLGDEPSSKIKVSSNGEVVTSVKGKSSKDTWQIYGNKSNVLIGNQSVGAPHKGKPYIRIKYYATGGKAGTIEITRQLTQEGPLYN